MKMVDHNPGGLPDPADIQKVLDVLAMFGMHGILIVGKECPNCGCVHRFSVASDLDNEGSENVPLILAEYAERTARQKPTTFDVAKPS